MRTITVARAANGSQKAVHRTVSFPYFTNVHTKTPLLVTVLIENRRPNAYEKRTDTSFLPYGDPPILIF